MTIWTSRFSNPELQTGKYTVVGIVRGLPRFKLKYQLDGNIIQIAPPRYLFHEENRGVFTGQYFQYMNSQGIEKIQSLLDIYKSKGKDIVLCCYEDVRIPNEWCHRLVFSEWYEQKTGGIKIEELSDSSTIKYPKGKKIIETIELNQKKIEYEQMTLFDLN